VLVAINIHTQNLAKINSLSLSATEATKSTNLSEGMDLVIVNVLPRIFDIHLSIGIPLIRCQRHRPILLPWSNHWIYLRQRYRYHPSYYRQ